MMVLALSPHTDDVEFACGGTIHRLHQAGHDVYVSTFSYCEDSVPDGLQKDILHIEQYRAQGILGYEQTLPSINLPVRHFPDHRQTILEYLVQKKLELKPDLVLCPASSDVHQDHATIRDECFRAFKHDASIWGYEIPWNVHPARPFFVHIYSKISGQNFAAKWKAVECYESQGFRSYMDRDYLIAHAALRGRESGCGLAEAFECIRIIDR